MAIYHTFRHLGLQVTTSVIFHPTGHKWCWYDEESDDDEEASDEDAAEASGPGVGNPRDLVFPNDTQATLVGKHEPSPTSTGQANDGESDESV